MTIDYLNPTQKRLWQQNDQTEQRKHDIALKKCKACRSYDFYSCKRKKSMTGPEASNETENHEKCFSLNPAYL